MKKLSALLAASTLALALASCSSTAPPAVEASASASAAPPSAAAAPIDAAAVSAGKQVYDTYCAACHSGANDTAPELATLHSFKHERVTAALSEGGLMTLQSKVLTPEQRAHVIAFITTPTDMGGDGTRLWPLSRSLFPKQLQPIASTRSLLQDAIARLSGPQFGPPIVVCNEDHRWWWRSFLTSGACAGYTLLYAIWYATHTTYHHTSHHPSVYCVTSLAPTCHCISTPLPFVFVCVRPLPTYS
jgi:mono/diheme cytochrome c family protein